ncbi:TetR family transcriptional regulator [Rhodocyclus tenuis]|uniref:Putative house-cleaning noncanonical NTP pyrophosphatase (MazG superfamily) n=1 Tax=Rhodocyclus tenuis TaxID=1066 RepID=A0A840G156_RHOTE|nr:TetR family transcriptional regulator [Rhodocyclus tenuis]MBB4247974.1 putative house-cleaning noncanonical NTP pyrophosphatase (MazG superfamily) [Rhodocyclus tenuis]
MRISEATQEALAANKRQSVRETREKLELALCHLVNGNPRIVKKGTRITAASVAKEASVDRVTLYRFHEPVLVKIRKINDTTPKVLLKENRSALAQSAAKQKEYRRLVEKAQEEVAALARINYRLDARVAELEELIRVRDRVISDLQNQLNGRGSNQITVSLNVSPL